MNSLNDLLRASPCIMLVASILVFLISSKFIALRFFSYIVITQVLDILLKQLSGKAFPGRAGIYRPPGAGNCMGCGIFPDCDGCVNVDDQIGTDFVPRDFDDLTFNVWVNLADWTNANTQQEVFFGTSGLGFTSTVQLYALLNQDRVVMFGRGGAMISVHYDYGSSIISGWHMVTGQISQVRAFNGTFSVGIFFDADNSSQLQQQVANVWAPTADQDMEIGAAVAADFMAGEIGSVHVWNRILSEREIKQLFRDSVSMFRTKQPVLARVAAAAPGGIPIFRRRIEGYCGKCHGDNMIVFKFDKPCERQPELAFNN
ncbi:hypothetical protein LCGC14_1214190 [marine sediment metagenome]|uniref:LamG-like jellyroll fold domain-containing protein n=1 Tax=marine sediment metagenome TaxID=412755 RepID=A0A0F9PHV8_9ZZZZ